MDVIVADSAQPQQVVGRVVAALGAERDVVRVGAGAAFADGAGFPDVLEAEPEDRFGVDDPAVGARVR